MQLNLKNHRANIFEKNPFDVNKTSIIFVPGAGMDHRIISMFNLEDPVSYTHLTLPTTHDV